jgi:hypothetical protein
MGGFVSAPWPKRAFAMATDEDWPSGKVQLDPFSVEGLVKARGETLEFFDYGKHSIFGCQGDWDMILQCKKI